jgi:hypothetical protein
VFAGSITLVTDQNEFGEWQDITEKEGIEQAIMRENEKKYKQSFHTPFYQFPLASDFGSKRTTPA